MNRNERKNKGAGTIIVHALIVLVLFLMAFRTPLPLPGEEGVEVDLGMMNQGMGNIQPDKPAIPQAAQPPQQPNKSKEDLVTQNDNEAPALEKPKNTKPKQETKPAEEQKPPRGFTWNDNSQAGGSEGTTGQPGDQGNPNGLAGIHQYDGPGGQGNGIHYDLGGRGAKSLGDPKKDFLEEGVVCVDIWVNKEGLVVDAKISTKGTYTSNADLKERALKAARLSKFFADPNAPEKQHGTITYNFVFNQ